MRLTLHCFLTLDGVMQAPGGAEEDTTAGFRHGGWQMPYVDDAMLEIVSGWFARADALLLGRTTFESFRAFWPTVTDPDDVLGTAINGRPRFVVSSTLGDPGWPGTTVLPGDPLASVRRLKEQPGGELQVHGSARLAHALHAAGLVDEYRLLTFPVTVGAGTRLFTDDAPATGYQLVDVRITPAGAVSTSLTPTPFRTGAVQVVDGHTLVSAH